MHELGMAKDLWSIIKKAADDSGLEKISKITITVGKNSGIDKDFLKHSLEDHVFPGTIAETALLDMIDGRIEMKCSNCGFRMDEDNMAGECVKCKGADFEIISGKEVFVTNIE